MQAQCVCVLSNRLVCHYRFLSLFLSLSFIRLWLFASSEHDLFLKCSLRIASNKDPHLLTSHSHPISSLSASGNVIEVN